MSKNKNINKKPKFSSYWIYGLILVIFLFINLFSGGVGSGGAPATPSDFFGYLRDGDVERVEIINKREARVYLTQEAEQKEIHKNSRKPQLLPISGQTPNYQFEFGEMELFQKELEDINKSSDLDVEVNYKTESNACGELLLSLLPFALIIGVWIFIMRRMSSGGGGGAGHAVQALQVWRAEGAARAPRPAGHHPPHERPAPRDVRGAVGRLRSTM